MEKGKEGGGRDERKERKHGEKNERWEGEREKDRDRENPSL